MQTDLAAALLIGLGTSALLLGAAVIGLSRVLRGEPRGPAPTGLEGAIGIVSMAIPVSGVGMIAHRRHGSRAALAARMHDGREALVGDEVVIVEVRNGVAQVAHMHLNPQEERRNHQCPP